MQAWIVTKKLLDYSYILLIKDHESGTVHYRKLHKAFKTHHRFLKAGWVGDLANTRRPWAAFHSKSGWYWLTNFFSSSITNLSACPIAIVLWSGYWLHRPQSFQAWSRTDHLHNGRTRIFPEHARTDDSTKNARTFRGERIMPSILESDYQFFRKIS